MTLDALPARPQSPRQEAAGTGTTSHPKRDHDAAIEALESIYAEHFDFVWRSLRRLGVHESLVDDAAHDVFLVVHRRLGDFEGRSSLRTWVFGIAHHTARAYRRRPQPVASDSVAEPIDERACPHLAHEQREKVALLYEALESLDEKRRAVFILAELEQMTAPEIADALGVKLNTVYSRLRVGRRQFEGALARLRDRSGSERRGGWRWPWQR